MNNRIETAITAACLVVLILRDAIAIADHEHVHELEELETEAVELGRKIYVLRNRIIAGDKE